MNSGPELTQYASRGHAGSWRQVRGNGLSALLSASVLLLVAAAGNPAIADDDEDDFVGQLTSRIEYTFVGFNGQFDSEGRLLVWEANVDGDLNGQMQWWIDLNLPDMNSIVGDREVDFYAARWEYRQDGVLLLAGESSGKTLWLDGAYGIFDGHGVVTEAEEQFEEMIGHKVYETGPVVFQAEPEMSIFGTGMFTIY